ncbi:MAG: methyltransferase [Novosphingobium sp.]|uniref:methyltransferase n=1 Tax=Novosphingobium sp. TaxID=1874826 RepID=UPI0030166661
MSTQLEPPQSDSLRLRWISWRNRMLTSPRFQQWAAAFPLTRPIVRARARRAFDLVAGFAYAQVLAACVEAGLLDLLAEGVCDTATAANRARLGLPATERLLRAAASLGIAESLPGGRWTLGMDGAALQCNPGALAMIRHHALLYRDLADPLALLRADRQEPTALSDFWTYARASATGAVPPGKQGAADNEPAAAAYSALMAASQAMVSEQLIAAYRFGRHKAMLDVGGGTGAFLRAVGMAAPQVRLGLFDLPDVVAGAETTLARDALIAPRLTLHKGSFLHDPLPEGHDLITLVRILHDHDDEPALRILRAVRAALPPGGTLLIGEPMAGAPGGAAMGDAYFGLYLWAMGSGRPRRPAELGAMLRGAGFASWKELPTHLPLVCGAIVARV